MASGPNIKPVGGGKSSNKKKQQKGSGDQSQFDIYQLGVNGNNQWVYGQALPGAYEFFFNQPAPGSSGVLAHPGAGKELTAAQAIQQFQKLSGYQLAQVQQKLYRAGLYGSQTPIYGVYGDQDLAAFRKLVIGLANGPHDGGQNLDNYLNQVASLGDTQGVNAVRKAPLVIHHVDDNTLKLVFQDTVQKLIGHNMDDGQLNQMVSAYHAAETTNQTAAYNAGDPNVTGVLTGGLGGEATTTPAPTDFAAAQIKEQDPTGVAAESFGNKFQQMLDAFTKPTV